jgi:hypothetical protein
MLVVWFVVRIYGFLEMGCDDGHNFKVGIQTEFTGGPLRQPLVACICCTCQLPANTVAYLLVIAWFEPIKYGLWFRYPTACSNIRFTNRGAEEHVSVVSRHNNAADKEQGGVTWNANIGEVIRVNSLALLVGDN